MRTRRFAISLAMTATLYLADFDRSAGAASPISAASPTSGVQIVTLGTGGGPVNRQNRSETATALLVGGSTYLIDAGDGVLRQMAAAKIPLPSLKAVFITHNHIDHNGDLGLLLIKRWLFRGFSPLTVVGPPGTAALVNGTLAANRTVELAPVVSGGPPPPFLSASAAPQDLPLDLPNPKLIYSDGTIRVMAVVNAHYHFPAGSEPARVARSYAYRIEASGRTIAFTGDSGPSPALTAIARGADILVSEVINLPATISSLRAIAGLDDAAMNAMIAHQKEDHMTPEQVGMLAHDAGVKQVVLSHLAPGLDEEKDVTLYSQGVRKFFKGSVSVASDLERF